MTTHDDGEGPVERRVSRHTPGPWRVKGARIHDCQPGIDCIATMQVSNQPNWDADAALIAAAPELLECLRAVELLFAPHCRDSTQADWLDRTQRLLRRLGAG